MFNVQTATNQLAPITALAGELGSSFVWQRATSVNTATNVRVRGVCGQ
jgi:hypothetical protein